MPLVMLVSFRFGAPDGVSVESAKWVDAFHRLGWSVRTVAGEGTADVLVAGIARDALEPPDVGRLADVLADADLVVVENLCSLPLNPSASEAVTALVAGRPAILHHHDLPWQRARFAATTYRVPDDPRWRHVTINDLSRNQLRARGLEATTIRNAFDTNVAAGDREGTRATLAVGPRELLVLQPTRAIARKNIPAAIALAEALEATYWLLGPAEDGFDGELDQILTNTTAPWIHGPGRTKAQRDVAHAYAAADLVAFPSTWEGFGNPVVESAIHRRPLAIGDYPVARELARFGFRWLDSADHAAVRAWLDRPDDEWLDHNREVARRFFSLPVLDTALERLLADVLSGPRS